MVRREPGEVVDGAAQGHEHVLALDVAAEHRARGPGRREARVGLLVRLRARLVADGVRRVGRRERIRGDDARVPPVHHAPRLFGGGGGADVAAAAREEGDLLGGQEVAEHVRPELRREPRPLLAPAPLVLPGAARAAPHAHAGCRAVNVSLAGGSSLLSTVTSAEDKNDDNADIEAYLGHANYQVIYKLTEDRTFSLRLMNNLRSTNRTSVEFGYSFPMGDTIKGFFQYYNGYGESLIDYNHRIERFGVGIMLNDWF